MNPFRDHMASLSDEQLLRVMVERKDYVPEALRAAERELASREVPTHDINAAILKGHELSQIAREREQIPLETWQLWAYFLLSFLSFTPFVAFFYGYHSSQGYSLKSTQSMRQVLLGILFYAALISTLNRFLF